MQIVHVDIRVMYFYVHTYLKQYITHVLLFCLVKL